MAFVDELEHVTLYKLCQFDIEAFEADIRRFGAESLGDSLYLFRKGHSTRYEPDEPSVTEADEEDEPEPSETIWPEMSDAEIRKAERKRANRR
jgi:hypothetical protein